MRYTNIVCPILIVTVLCILNYHCFHFCFISFHQLSIRKFSFFCVCVFSVFDLVFFFVHLWLCGLQALIWVRRRTLLFMLVCVCLRVRLITYNAQNVLNYWIELNWNSLVCRRAEIFKMMESACPTVRRPWSTTRGWCATSPTPTPSTHMVPCVWRNVQVSSQYREIQVAIFFCA
jgi:hypothetical protein